MSLIVSLLPKVMLPLTQMGPVTLRVALLLSVKSPLISTGPRETVWLLEIVVAPWMLPAAAEVSQPEIWLFGYRQRGWRRVRAAGIFCAVNGAAG